MAESRASRIRRPPSPRDKDRERASRKFEREARRRRLLSRPDRAADRAATRQLTAPGPAPAPGVDVRACGRVNVLCVACRNHCVPRRRRCAITEKGIAGENRRAPRVRAREKRKGEIKRRRTSAWDCTALCGGARETYANLTVVFKPQRAPPTAASRLAARLRRVSAVSPT